MGLWLWAALVWDLDLASISEAQVLARELAAALVALAMKGGPFEEVALPFDLIEHPLEMGRPSVQAAESYLMRVLGGLGRPVVWVSFLLRAMSPIQLR